VDELEYLKARESRRLSPEVANPTVVRSLDEIKIVISELDPDRQAPSEEIKISTIMDTPTARPHTAYQVSANTRSKTRREYLLEGMDLVKKSIADSTEDQTPTFINGVEVRPARLIDRLAMKAWVDNLIQHWLGARRDGLLITWTLDDGYRYNYDIYEHRLSRIKIEKA